MSATKFGPTIAVAAALLSALSVNSCTEKKYVNQPITDSSHVHGIVRAWRCAVGDVLNNPQDPSRLRYSVYTGEPAAVTFVRDNGFTSIVETDDSSEFDVYLSAGSHKIVVKSGYTFPADTFYNIQLKPGDTTLVLDIVYAVLDPLNITCVFSYPTIEDTLSTESEWDVIRELNQRSYIGGKPLPVFNFDQVALPSELRRVHQSAYTSHVYVTYQLPIRREYQGYGKMWNVSEANNLLLRIIEGDTTGFFLDNFSLYPSGSYACMW